MELKKKNFFKYQTNQRNIKIDSVHFRFNVCVYVYIYLRDIGHWVECSPMVWEARVQSLFESYQKTKKKKKKKKKKEVLDATLLNTQHYKVRIKGKLVQSREWSNALPYTLV